MSKKYDCFEIKPEISNYTKPHSVKTIFFKKCLENYNLNKKSLKFVFKLLHKNIQIVLPIFGKVKFVLKDEDFVVVFYNLSRGIRFSEVIK